MQCRGICFTPHVPLAVLPPTSALKPTPLRKRSRSPRLLSTAAAGALGSHCTARSTPPPPHPTHTLAHARTHTRTHTASPPPSFSPPGGPAGPCSLKPLQSKDLSTQFYCHLSLHCHITVFPAAIYYSLLSLPFTVSTAHAALLCFHCHPRLCAGGLPVPPHSTVQCYMIVLLRQVYDFTEFLERHPGGGRCSAAYVSSSRTLHSLMRQLDPPPSLPTQTHTPVG